MITLKIESAHVRQSESIIDYVKTASTGLPLSARQMIIAELLSVFQMELRALQKERNKGPGDA